MRQRRKGQRAGKKRKTVRVFVSPGFTQKSSSGVYGKNGKPVAPPLVQTNGTSVVSEKDTAIIDDQDTMEPLVDDGWLDAVVPEPEVDSWVNEESDAQFDEVDDAEDAVDTEEDIPEDLSSFFLFLGPVEGEPAEPNDGLEVEQDQIYASEQEEAEEVTPVVAPDPEIESLPEDDEALPVSGRPIIKDRPEIKAESPPPPIPSVIKWKKK